MVFECSFAVDPFSKCWKLLNLCVPQSGKPAVPVPTGCCAPKSADAIQHDFPTIYYAGAVIKNVEAVGKKAVSKRGVMVLTSKYVDMVNERSFDRVDRIRSQLGPLVSAHLISGSLLSKYWEVRLHLIPCIGVCSSVLDSFAVLSSYCGCLCGTVGHAVLPQRLPLSLTLWL